MSRQESQARKVMRATVDMYAKGCPEEVVAEAMETVIHFRKWTKKSMATITEDEFASALDDAWSLHITRIGEEYRRQIAAHAKFQANY